MKISELKSTYWRLVDQHMKAVAEAKGVAEQHGLSMQQIYIEPAIDHDLLKHEAELGKVTTLRDIDAGRRRKLESLPTAVRVAVVHSLELNDLASDARMELVFATNKPGRTAEEIAKRLGFAVSDVQRILGLDPD